MDKTIYLDYMATTPVDPRVVAEMQQCLDINGIFGNPASHSHRFGYEAQQKVQQATQQVASLINADPREIVWTSGATESDNLAIIGAAHFYRRKGQHIITMATEHKAVLDTCKHLESEGFDVTYLQPEASGILDLSKLEAALRDDTILVSIMHVNNETGVIQDLAAIGELLKGRGILFHSDAAQSAGKLPIDVNALNIDLMSFSGHKIYGPKGIGVLYVRRTPRVRLEAQIHGGGHQRGMRSGTLATHQIVGMGEAFAIAQSDMSKDATRLSGYRNRLWEKLSALGGVTLNGDLAQQVCGCLNVCVEGVASELLLLNLPELAISTGSACTSASPDPSHVLSAMGLTRNQANSSLRISVGRFTTDQDVDFAVEVLSRHIQECRNKKSVWKA